MIALGNLLTEGIQNSGNEVAIMISNALYTSPFGHFVKQFSVMMIILTIATKLGKVDSESFEVSKRTTGYLLAAVFSSLLIMPAPSGRPFGMAMFETIAEMLVNTLEKKVIAPLVTGGKEGFANKTYLMDMVSESLNCEVPEEEKPILEALRKKCIPHGKIDDGTRNIALIDLVSGTVLDHYGAPFDLGKLSEKSFTITSKGRDVQINCKDLRDTFISRRLENLEKKYYGKIKKNAIDKSTLKLFKKEYPTDKAMKNLVNIKHQCMNYNIKGYTNDLAEATRSAQVSNEYIDAGNWYNSVTGFVSRMWNGAIRWTGLSHESERATLENQYREMILDFPYAISIAYLALQVSFSFVVYVPYLTGNLFFVKAWTTAYFAVVLSGYVLIIMRLGYSNMLHSIPELQSFAESYSLVGTTFTFSAIENIQDELARSIVAYLKFEQRVLMFIMAGVPAMGGLMMFNRSSTGGRIGNSMKQLFQKNGVGQTRKFASDVMDQSSMLNKVKEGASNKFSAGSMKVASAIDKGAPIVSATKAGASKIGAASASMATAGASKVAAMATVGGPIGTVAGVVSIGATLAKKGMDVATSSGGQQKNDSSTEKGAKQ